MIVFATTFAAGQQVQIIVPNSVPAINRIFLFTDESSGNLILLYEKRIVSPVTLALEVRKSDNLGLLKRFSPRMNPGENLRIAEYKPPFGIFAIVQGRSQLSTLKIDPSTGKMQRFPLYSMEEAHRLDRSIRSITPAGLTWNDRQQKAVLLLNLSSAERTITLLAAINSTGARDAAPSRIDAGKGEHLDLAYNTCSGELAAATPAVVRLLRGQLVRPLSRPEEIGFDPDLCRFGVVRRPFNEIPQFYFLDGSLHIQSFRQLPGGVAPQLIEESRDQVIYNKERKSFIYPTWADHQRLYINEITPSGVRTSLLTTSPIDASTMSVASRNNQVFLLLAGLQFGTYDHFHRLVLVRTSVP